MAFAWAQVKLSQQLNIIWLIFIYFLYWLMCRPWSKQLNWWDSISFFWFHADDWLQNDQVLWSMLEILTIIDSPVGIVVPGSYSGFLGRLPYVLCVSGCVCLQHVLIFFISYIYLFIWAAVCYSSLSSLYWCEPVGHPKLTSDLMFTFAVPKSKALSDWHTEPQSRKV